MRDNRALLLTPVLGLLLIWSILSFVISTSKSSSGACGKEFQVDYILFTNLFCEIEGEETK